MKTLIKLSKKLTIVLTLLSLFVPTTLTLINVNAQESNHQQINVEITNKDGSKEVKTTTIENLDTNPIIKTPKENEIVQVESNPEQIEELQTSGAIVYDKNDFASLNIPVLQNLGYSQSEIEELKKLTDNYNATPVKEVKITTKSVENNLASFGINASAACEYEYRATKYLYWTEIYMNQCLIADITKGAAGGDFVALGLTGAGYGALVIPPVAAVLATISLYAVLLDATSSQCSDEGANLNVADETARKIVGIPAWVSSVC